MWSRAPSTRSAASGRRHVPDSPTEARTRSDSRRSAGDGAGYSSSLWRRCCRPRPCTRARACSSGRVRGRGAPREPRRVSTRRRCVVESYSGSGHPGDIVVAGGDVWVERLLRGGHLALIALDRERCSGSRRTAEPRDLAVGGDDLYVASGRRVPFTGVVSRYDVSTGIRRGRGRLLACAIASGEGVVWTAGCPYVSDSTAVGRAPQARRGAPAVRSRSDVGDLRVCLPGARRRRRVALGARRRARPPPLAPRRRARDAFAPPSSWFTPRSFAVGGGAAWITDALGDEVERLDPDDRARIEAPSRRPSPRWRRRSPRLGLGPERARRHGVADRRRDGRVVDDDRRRGFPREVAAGETCGLGEGYED